VIFPGGKLPTGLTVSSAAEGGSIGASGWPSGGEAAPSIRPQVTPVVAAVVGGCPSLRLGGTFSGTFSRSTFSRRSSASTKPRDGCLYGRARRTAPPERESCSTRGQGADWPTANCCPPCRGHRGCCGPPKEGSGSGRGVVAFVAWLQSQSHRGQHSNYSAYAKY